MTSSWSPWPAKGATRRRSTKRSPSPTSSTPATSCATSTRSPNHQDGFVSLEVAADLAHDEQRSIEAARDLLAARQAAQRDDQDPRHARGRRTRSSRAIYEGININVTLLFSVEGYEKVHDAYLKGLERRQAEGKPLDVASVASFFVSRVDTAVDKLLEASGHEELYGKAAIANARVAYRSFEAVLASPRWEGLHHGGAHPQRPLWASTGVKNERYPDTMYVDELVGAHTVNTMPLATLEAVADHGRISGPTAQHDPAQRSRGDEKAGST